MGHESERLFLRIQPPFITFGVGDRFKGMPERIALEHVRGPMIGGGNHLDFWIPEGKERGNGEGVVWAIETLTQKYAATLRELRWVMNYQRLKIGHTLRNGDSLMPRKTIAGLEAQLEELQKQYGQLEADHGHSVTVNNSLRDIIAGLTGQISDATDKVFDLEVQAEGYRKILRRRLWEYIAGITGGLVVGFFVAMMVCT